MPDESVTSTASAAVAADPTLEQQLESLRPTPQESTPAATPSPGVAAPLSPPPADGSQPAGTSSETDLSEKLAKISDSPAEEVKPLSEEQQRILAIIPNAQSAQTISELATGYQNFTNAFEQGDFENVERMFEGWNPQAYEAFLEHVYQKRVSSGEWVDRWIADKEGNTTVNRGMAALQQQVARLQQQLQSRQSSEQQAQQQQQQAAIAQNYLGHLNSLFDQIDFSAADRRWVLADIHNRVAASPQVRSAINSGNTAAVNPVFKAAVREYVERDKALASGKDAQQAVQDKKKPLLSAQSPIGNTGALPDDIRQVPRGSEDAWLDQELAKLARATKR